MWSSVAQILIETVSDDYDCHEEHVISYVASLVALIIYLLNPKRKHQPWNVNSEISTPYAIAAEMQWENWNDIFSRKG